jgi:tetratricopeptide (TPR) repeat protein
MLLVLGLFFTADFAAVNVAIKEGRSLLEQARYEDAERSFRAALNEAEKDGRDSRAYATAAGCLGSANWFLGNLAAAERYSSEALRIRERILGPDHAETGDAYNNLGVIYQRLGDSRKRRGTS